MDTQELRRELSRWRPFALGVFPSSELTNLTINSGEGAVINTAPSGTEGQHWLALYRAPEDGVLEMFDPYGLPLEAFPIVKEQLIKNNEVQVRRNSGQLQSDRADSCGIYCLLFLML